MYSPVVGRRPLPLLPQADGVLARGNAPGENSIGDSLASAGRSSGSPKIPSVTSSVVDALVGALDLDPMDGALDALDLDLDLMFRAVSEPAGEIALRPSTSFLLAFLLPSSASLLFSSWIFSLAWCPILELSGPGLVDGRRVPLPSQVSGSGTSSTLGCSGASPFF